MSTIDKTYAYPHLWRMGKFLSKTLLILALLVNPAFADGFSFTDTVHSEWTGEDSIRVEVINNPEDDYIHVVNSKNNLNIFCHPTSKKATKAVFQCGKQEIQARYSNGTLYFNDAPYKRVNGN